jgi:uncharacterized membrane protein YdjX (TVP38/TMEM64 family)
LGRCLVLTLFTPSADRRVIQDWINRPDHTGQFRSAAGQLYELLRKCRALERALFAIPCAASLVCLAAAAALKFAGVWGWKLALAGGAGAAAVAFLLAYLAVYAYVRKVRTELVQLLRKRAAFDEAHFIVKELKGLDRSLGPVIEKHLDL